MCWFWQNFIKLHKLVSLWKELPHLIAMPTTNGLGCLHSCFPDPEVVVWRWLNVFQGNLNVAEQLFLVYSDDAFPWRSEAWKQHLLILMPLLCCSLSSICWVKSQISLSATGSRASLLWCSVGMSVHACLLWVFSSLKRRICGRLI